MRKKQLYAIILAGVLATGSAPTAAFAAEAEAVPTAAETPAANTEENSEGQASQTPETPAEPETPVTPETPTEPTVPETPVTPEAPAEPTVPETPVTPEAPTVLETPATPEAPAEPTAPETPETPAEPTAPVTPATPETPTAEEPAAEGETTPEEPEAPQTDKPEGWTENTETGVYINFINADGTETKEYYLSLQQALNAAIQYYQAEDHDKSKAVVVKIEKQFSLSETVKIENGKINLVATNDVSIGRGIDANDPSKMLLGNMFEITGEGSELQLSTEGEGKLSISGKNPGDGSQPVTGSLISVSNNGSFGMSEGVVLFENITTADGAAIHAAGTENVVLKGGVITGNTGAKGAVYTDKNICMQGAVQIKENFNAEKSNANLYLDQDARVLVTDVLKDSEIHVTSAKAADKAVIAQAGTRADGTALTEEEFKTVPEQLKYDDEKAYSVVLGEDKLTAVLKKEGGEEPQPTPNQPKVTDSKITGLENPLQFFPNKSYKFTVVGAGQDNKNPNNGDTRWQPLYWAQKENPAEKEQHKNWNIKIEKGYRKAATFNMYVFFRQQSYDAAQKKWVDTDTVEYVKTTFKSAAISDEEWNDYIGKFLAYQSGSFKWVDHSTAFVKVSTTKDIKWGYGYADATASSAEITKKAKEIKLDKTQKADTSISVTAEKVPEKNSLLIVAGKSDKGDFDFVTIKLNSNSRPDVPAEPTKPVRKPRKYDVSESKVTGLENPLQFYPRKFYDFQVVGAGQNDKDPISGDERWIPQYWSMSVNGAKNTSWRIGSQEKGIREAAEYPLYIYFKKQTYNGKEWVDTDVVEYMKTSFRSAEISDDEWNAYIDDYNAANPEDGLNYDGTSAGSVADLTPTEAPSAQDTGATTRSAADTADTSPIGSMSALAALSLLAGGYVIVRKRKKEEI